MENDASYLTQPQAKLIEDYNLSNLSERDLLLLAVSAINKMNDTQNVFRNELVDQKREIRKTSNTVSKLRLRLWKTSVVVGAAMLAVSIAIPDVAKVVRPVLNTLFGGV